MQHLNLENLLDPEYFIQNMTTIENLLSDGLILQKVLGFTDEMMEQKAKIASKHYQRREFDLSRDTFSYLALLNPFIASYWMGIAASQAHLEQYEAAVKSYHMMSVIHPCDPRPLYFASHIYLKLDKPMEALRSLTLAHRMAAQDVQFHMLAIKITSQLEAMKKKIGVEDVSDLTN